MANVLSKTVISIFLLLLFIISGCTGNSKDLYNSTVENKVKPEKVSTHFAIALVKGVKTADAMKSKIDELPLETDPMIADTDLISYKWENHELELRKGFDLYKMLGSVPTDGLPFVVIADGKRIYVGAFWTQISSASASIPVIVTPNKVIKIDQGYPGKMTNGQLDQGSDTRIYNALKNIGKIKD